MNELMIVLEGGNYIYYKTKLNKAWDALREFEWSCESVGINIDNVGITSAELRNVDTVLDKWVGPMKW